ncbi:MAG: hypothetical protein Q9214_002187 [Letrouitia sp. 1 TL-2023]
MPRATKKAAHQHNNRHENGVVAPGKRITKQKSNGHLSERSDGISDSHATLFPSPSAPYQLTTLPDGVTNGSSTSANYGSDRSIFTRRLPKEPPGDVPEELEAMGNGTAYGNGTLEHTYRKIDVSAAKTPSVHDNTMFHLTFTILRSCPLGDTIAILIFLLSLPTSLLMVTNTLFAILTFMPPAVSFSSFPSTLNDVFQGSGGAPSLATILVTDMLGLVIWLGMWTPLQVLGLELAQAVVATTLGGGTSSKTSGSDITLYCMLVVTFTHVARQKWMPKRIFGYEWSVRLASLSNSFQKFSFLSSEEHDLPRSPRGWFRILVALHILIQGLVHVARRWYTKRYSQSIPFSKKVETEVVGSSQAHEGSGTPALHISGGSSDLATKPLITASRESRDKLSSGKKRRKQGTYVRSQQPLWAAFAATKVTVIREMEQSQALSEAVGSNATDIKNLGSAPFVSEEGRIWVTMIQPNGFFFDASYFTPNRFLDDVNHAHDIVVATGIDRSKPFFVRINGADWTSTRIHGLMQEASEDQGAAQQWTGEVFGLSPSSSYNCSFVRSEDGVVIHSAIVSTPSSPSAERESSALTSPPQPSLRPSSPTTPSTTLKKSIAAFETSLSECQARQKRNKKEAKASSTALKKEIEILNGKIAKISGEDKAHSNRHLQWSQNYKQADEAVASISSEIESMGSIPEEDLEQWRAMKLSWEEGKGLQQSAQEDFFRCKDAAHQEKLAVQAEASTTVQKRERLQARRTKLNDQHDRLLTATTEGLNEKGRREAEQAAKATERHLIEEKSSEQMATISKAIEEIQYQTLQVSQQAEVLSSAFQPHQPQHGFNTGVDFDNMLPEGKLPGTGNQPSGTSRVRFPGLGSRDSFGLQNNPTSYRNENRPRSTSLLSGSVQGTDFLDQDPAPPMPSSQAMRMIRSRQQSGSSGSGSGGSQRDPTSPVSAIGTRMSPVVKKGSPVWNQV